MLLNNQKSPEEILQRIDELQRWQEQQQQMLIQRQISQRQILSDEHRNVCTILGFSSSPISYVDRDPLGMISLDESSTMNLGNSSATEALNNERIKSITNIRDLPETNENVEQNTGIENVFSKKQFLRKGEGLVNRFKVHPDKFRLDNLPKYKFANVHRRNGSKNIRQRESKAQEVRVSEDIEQQCTKDADSGDAIHEVQTTIMEEEKTSEKFEGGIEHSIAEPASWADVLNPNNIKPISIDMLRKFTESFNTDDSFKDDEVDNLNLFELLERKAEEGSLLLDTSLLRRWVQNNQAASSDIDESYGPTTSVINRRVSPLPCDITKKVIVDTSDSSSNISEDFSGVRSDKCVRFSDHVVINEIDDMSFAESTNSTDDRFDCESLRAELLQYDNETSSDLSNTITNNSMEEEKIELIKKTERLKIRLADLEKEIADFQKHNAELVKLKQECQLERLRIDQERVEMKEKLTDERVRMEMELHDERMRLEEEKKKYERLMKENRTRHKKEDEEIVKLREKVEQLHKEMREKDTKHTASQARLRAQIRNLEKDLKDSSLELDHLKRGKKQLEFENTRLTRNNNNKLLHEINKSIIKLVPKAVPEVEELQNKNPKPTLAKVTSHRSIGNVSQLSKSKIKSTPSQRLPSSQLSNTGSTDSSDSNVEEESTYFKQQMDFTATRDQNLARNENGQEACQISESLSMKDETKREIQNEDGSKDIWYTNGNLKKISADGMVIRMLYYNKDIKETNIHEGTVKYYYAETNTWHTTYLDGLEILEFPNGQTEHRYKDGTIEVHFDNGSIRITNPTDPVREEEWRYPDGTKLVQLKTGDRILSMPNGQKEIHTKVHKRREYPDGTVKIVYPDGSQETRYSNGRVRLKDKDGNLVMDSDQL